MCIQFLALANSPKEIFQSQSKVVDAFHTDSHDGKTFNHTIVTIHTSYCELLVSHASCNNFKQYWYTLYSLYSKWISQSRSERDKHTSHTNYRYLKSPEKSECMSSPMTELGGKIQDLCEKMLMKDMLFPFKLNLKLTLYIQPFSHVKC